ncbi:L-asparaginase-like [Diadema antillarum]|uniref:L-asparaginase-like n=1 Tax=Diadema antillarum TaxID=105358 RepID=UPI003A8670D8
MMTTTPQTPDAKSSGFTIKFKPELATQLKSLKRVGSRDLTQPDDSSESRVLVIYVGGTIGMKKENDVYSPVKDHMAHVIRSMPMLYDKEYAKDIGLDKAEQNIFVLPTSKDRRVIYCLKEYETLKDSSNVNVGDWVQIAEDIQESYRQFDGFVIIHGTDTMAYTASALSFMLENLGKPVVLTGSQVPLSELRSDGRDNFLGAVFMAGHYVIPEVSLFFNNKLYRGNRCVKISSDSFNAFDSPNCSPLASMAVDVSVNWANIFRPNTIESFCINTNMNRNVGLLRIFPSITAETVRAFLQPPMEGAVLQTYGAGNCPDDRLDLISEIKAAAARGMIIMNCTQCASGSVSPSYHTGKVLLDAGVIPGSDITPEAALSKLSYVLGQEGLSLEQKRQQLKHNLRGEISVTFDSGRSFTLDNSEFIKAVVDTLKIGSSKEVEAVRASLFPPLLCAAARNGDLQSIKYMQKSGADLAGADYDGRTALHLAASEGHTDIVRYLLEHGCPIYARDRFGNTPFMDSIRNKRFEIIELMKQAGGHLIHESLHDLGVLLCSAAAMDATDGLKAFTLAGVDMSCTDYSGNTALHVAAMNNQLDSVQFLLESGGIPANKPNAQGFTALQLAMQHGLHQVGAFIEEFISRQRQKKVAPGHGFTLSGS